MIPFCRLARKSPDLPQRLFCGGAAKRERLFIDLKKLRLGARERLGHRLQPQILRKRRKRGKRTGDHHVGGAVVADLLRQRGSIHEDRIRQRHLERTDEIRHFGLLARGDRDGREVHIVDKCLAPHLQLRCAAKRLKTIAHVVEFGGGGKGKDRLQNALLRLPDLADDEKLTFAPGADQAFLAKVGSDTRTIVSELQKMRAYLGTERNEVTTEDVAAVTSVGGDEPELWAIHDAVSQRSPSALLKALAPYEKDGAGILIATVMEKYFREAIVCRDALDHGWLDKWGRWSDKMPPAAREALDAAGFGPTTAKNSWAVKNAVRRAIPFTLTELRVARYRMLAAREKLVSSDAGDALVVSELLRTISKPRTKQPC